jgi:hypothetical protein
MPTNMQRSVPHEHAIDGVVFPAIRERMITYRGKQNVHLILLALMGCNPGKYDLLEAINGIITGVRPDQLVETGLTGRSARSTVTIR